VGQVGRTVSTLDGIPVASFTACPERYELSSQARRAAYSVAANIVEGFARRSPKDRSHFLHIAEASLAELGYCLHVARRLDYISKETFGELETEVKKTGAPLSGLIDRLGQARRI
jgi:four helix bundle protein